MNEYTWEYEKKWWEPKTLSKDEAAKKAKLFLDKMKSKNWTIVLWKQVDSWKYRLSNDLLNVHLYEVYNNATKRIYYMVDLNILDHNNDSIDVEDLKVYDDPNEALKGQLNVLKLLQEKMIQVTNTLNQIGVEVD